MSSRSLYCAETFPNDALPFGHELPQRVRRTYVLATQKRASSDELIRYNFHHMNVVDGPTGIAAQPEHRTTLNGWARAHHAIPDPLKIDGRRTVLDHGPDGMPRERLTVASCSNVMKSGVGGLSKLIQDLEDLDYWRSAHNLFPDFE